MGKKARIPVVPGPLAPYAAGFGSWLRSQAYSSSAVAGRLRQFDQVSRWLEREGLGVSELTDEQAGRFAVARRAAGLSTWVSPRSMALLLGYLRELGAAPAPVPALAQGPLEEPGDLILALGELDLVRRRGDLMELDLGVRPAVGRFPAGAREIQQLVPRDPAHPAPERRPRLVRPELAEAREDRREDLLGDVRHLVLRDPPLPAPVVDQRGIQSHEPLPGLRLASHRTPQQ